MMRFMLLIVFWLFTGRASAAEVVYSKYTGIEIAGKEHLAFRFLFRTTEDSLVRNLSALLLLQHKSGSTYPRLLIAKSVSGVCGMFPEKEPTDDLDSVLDNLKKIEGLPESNGWLIRELNEKPAKLKKDLEKKEWGLKKESHGPGKKNMKVMRILLEEC